MVQLRPTSYRGLPPWLFLLLSLFASTASSDDRELPKPILRKCGPCHGDATRKGNLQLTQREGWRRGGDSGEPLVGEVLADGLVWQMIAGGDMPPEGAEPLTLEETQQIREWIQAEETRSWIEDPADRVIHQHQVLPILLLRCTPCHGSRLKQAELDLRTRMEILRGGQSGPAIVPGAPDASLMIQRIESEACPPQELLLKYFVRRPSHAETQRLRQWIAAGAPELDLSPDVATTATDPLVSDQDRQHWAYLPIQPPNGTTSIDQLIGAKLSAVGLSRSPRADRVTLIRRLFLNVTGLPPSPTELHRWRTRESTRWYAELVDELLASPQYGERWGRYWLDLAGYADSEGGVSADPLRTSAWKYRDYVIRAFNADKPYDQFLLEQLAGDELYDYQRVNEITDEMVESLVATGFLRMGVDETGSRTMNFVPERLKVISDAIQVVSGGLMAMTMECARCHSHKYDAIPQRDYYRLKAIFQGALDEYDWLTFKTRKLSVQTPAQQARVQRVNPPLARELARLRREKQQREGQTRLALLEHYFPELTAMDREATLAALKVADNSRTLKQRMLVERLQQVEILPESAHPKHIAAHLEQARQIDIQQDRIRRRMVPDASIRALWDVGYASPTYLLRRGEHDKPGPWVGPGVPSVLTDGRTPFEVVPPFPGGTPKTGRRLAFARWLIRPEHPLTARVMVNRIWYHHFGTGLVQSLDNFGTQGDRPTHPQLLDWLADQFIQSGWSIKHIHRLILNSATFQQASRVTQEQLRLDPENRLLSRMPIRRLDAEALRDSLLAVAGRLDLTPGGIPDPVRVSADGLVRVMPAESGNWRRSIYAQFRRTEIPSLLATFDYPKMGPNCLNRNVSTVSLQALMLSNDAHIRELSQSFADRILRSLPADGELPPDEIHRKWISRAYEIALSRMPSPEERSIASRGLETLEAGWQGDRARALATLCHTLLNSAAFVYVD